MRLPAKFETRLALIAFAGLMIRLLYAGLHRKYPVLGDALTFHLDAAHLADGHGFQRPWEAVPTAEHPPLHIVVLAFLDVIGLTGTLPHRFAMCFIGTGTVVALGFLGRTVAGSRAGLIAAGIGAVYPLLWVIDGAIMSETEYALLITLMLLTAYRYLRGPSVRWALILAAVIALATLTRGEAVGFVVVLALPLAWRANTGWRAQLVAAALMVAAFCVVMAPWTIRNLTTFKEPVLISTNGDGVFIGANCHDSYYGGFIGAWSFACFTHQAPGDESQYSLDYRKRGLRYARQHAGRIPYVVLIRELREFDFYRPGQSIIFQATEGRNHHVARWGIRVYWLMLPFTIAGFVLLRRRRHPLQILLAPVILGILVAAVIYGSTRFRVVMEPVLIVAAAVAVDAIVGRWLAQRSSAAASSAPASPTATRVSAGISQSQSMEA